MKTYVTRLTRGTDVRAGIEQFQKQCGIKAGLVIAAVGCVSAASIRLADGATAADYQQPFEIVSLSGTLSADGSHLHISLADEQGQVIGGHLNYGTVVNTTLELAIMDAGAEYTFSRCFDQATGYDELQVTAVGVTAGPDSEKQN